MIKKYSFWKFCKLRHILQILLSIFLSSCGLFDKELKQDEHIARFKYQMARVADSLDTSKERIKAFKAIIEDIDEDKALITPRKKNSLLLDGSAYLSNEYLNVKNYKKALDYTNKMIEIDSVSYRGYYGRGCVYQAIGEDSLAIVDYTKTLGLNSNNADAYYNRALIFEKQENYDPALADFNKAAKLKPPYLADIYYNRGKIYKIKELYDKAIEEYSKVINLDTLNVRAYCNRGDSYFIQKKMDEAINDYNKSISLDSVNVYLYMKRAAAFEEVRNYNDALSDYKKVLRLDPDDRADHQAMVRNAIKKLKLLVKN